MNRTDALQVGIITKTRGISGEIILEVKDSYVLKNIKESVHLEIDGLLVPFFILSFQTISTTRARIIFDWVDNENKASKLVSSQVYIPTSDLKTEEQDETFSPSLLEGFEVVDQTKGSIGIVSQFIDQANNPLLIINSNRSEIIIPFQDDLIDNIDPDNKTIHINAPDGLIDLYL